MTSLPLVDLRAAVTVKGGGGYFLVHTGALLADGSRELRALSGDVAVDGPLCQ